MHKFENNYTLRSHDTHANTTIAFARVSSLSSQYKRLNKSKMVGSIFIKAELRFSNEIEDKRNAQFTLKFERVATKEELT